MTTAQSKIKITIKIKITNISHVTGNRPQKNKPLFKVVVGSAKTLLCFFAERYFICVYLFQKQYKQT